MTGETGSWVKTLTLTAFRNHAKLRLEAGPQPVIITGANGSGKTNLFEALSLLSPGRGMRQARLRDIATRSQETAFSVHARIVRDDLEVGIGTSHQSDADQPDRRAIVRDSTPLKRAADLSDILTVTWLTPAMDRLLVEGAAARRRFLDRMTFSLVPEHAHHVSQFQRQLKERNTLLAQPRLDHDWLDTVEAQLANFALTVAQNRATALNDINMSLRIAKDHFPTASLAFRGKLETSILSGDQPDDIASDYRAYLKQARTRDRETRTTQSGPHRTDFTAFDDGLDQNAAESSTGRQKTILMAIVLAQFRAIMAKRNQQPIMLLDEALAHLDRYHREALLHAVRQLGAQIWMNGTDQELFGDLRGHASFFTLQGKDIIADDK